MMNDAFDRNRDRRARASLPDVPFRHSYATKEFLKVLTPVVVP